MAKYKLQDLQSTNDVYVSFYIAPSMIFWKEVEKINPVEFNKLSISTPLTSNLRLRLIASSIHQNYSLYWIIKT